MHGLDVFVLDARVAAHDCAGALSQRAFSAQQRKVIPASWFTSTQGGSLLNTTPVLSVRLAALFHGNTTWLFGHTDILFSIKGASVDLDPDAPPQLSSCRCPECADLASAFPRAYHVHVASLYYYLGQTNALKSSVHHAHRFGSSMKPL